YYAFFACYLLLIAGAGAAVHRRKLHPLYTALTFIAITCAGVLANISPSLLFHHEHGNNPDVGRRLAIESEMYGMKVAQLILPIPRHRIPALASLRGEYEANSVSSTENALAALGTAGAAGFLFLLGRLLFRRRALDGSQEVPLDGLLDG